MESCPHKGAASSSMPVAILDLAAAEAEAKSICVSKGWVFARHAGEGQFKHSFLVQGPQGQDMALKVYKATGSVSERQRREIDAMARCNHRSIARLVTVEQHGAVVFSVEEFLAGGTLADRLTAGTLSKADAINLGAPLIAAVGHLHALGLVHRDIKPENIMFRSDGHPVLVDLGLVRDLAQPSVTQTWAPMGPGTPYYAAPEQLTNQKQMIDWRTDQFALGVVLSIAALGIHPYAVSPDQSETVARVMARQGPSPAFQASAGQGGLPTLARMVQAWPVHRFRLPTSLHDAWCHQA